MAAAKGNKYAVGADNGRPREHDRKKLAGELVKWAQKPESINLNEFCCIQMIPPSKIAQWAREEEDFRTAYELAKSFLGTRRELWLNQELLHTKAYDLNAAVYDYFLKEEKRDQAAFEVKLKAKEEEQVGEQAVTQFNAFMSQLDALQSARKIEESKTNSEQKS